MSYRHSRDRKKKQLRKLWERSRGVCFYCQRKVSLEAASVEHLGPAGKELAHRTCNGVAGALSLVHKLELAEVMTSARRPLHAGNQWVIENRLMAERNGRHGDARKFFSTLPSTPCDDDEFREQMVDLWGPPRDR
jgi:hypothetical protein